MARAPGLPKGTDTHGVFIVQASTERAVRISLAINGGKVVAPDFEREGEGFVFQGTPSIDLTVYLSTDADFTLTTHFAVPNREASLTCIFTMWGEVVSRQEIRGDQMSIQHIGARWKSP